jgi:virginiamycin B lyase
MAVGIDEIPIPKSTGPLSGLAVAPDGGVWVTSGSWENDGQVWRVAPDGTVALVESGSDLTNASFPTRGPDGALWVVSGSFLFREFQITHLGPGGPRSYHLPSFPGGVCVGPDGNFWITGSRPSWTGDPQGVIVRLSPRGAETLFPVPDMGGAPGQVVAGPGGDLWFVGAGQIGKITPSGAITEYPAEDASGAITVGPDGNLWYTISTGDGGTAIGRMTPTGQITVFPLEGGLGPLGDIVSGPDGAVWFTDPNREEVGRVTPDGRITEYPAPNASGQPIGIVNDGRGLWFAEPSSGPPKVGRVLTGLPEPAFSVRALPVHADEAPFRGDLPVASFTSPDPGASPDDFQARVSMDRRNYDGTIRADGQGGFVVEAPVTSPDGPGRYLLTVTILDVRHHHAVGATSSATGVATIDAVPLSGTGQDFTVAAGAEFRGEVATFVDPAPESLSEKYQVTIDWGDGTTTSAGEYLSSQGVLGGTFLNIVKGDHTYSRSGTYHIVVTIGDQAAGLVVGAVATVTPAPPVLQAVPVSLQIGQSACWVPVAYFAKADPDDQAADFAPTIDWGDGTSSPGRIEAVDDVGFVVFGIHSYRTFPNQRVSVTVGDVRTGHPAVSVETPVDAEMKPLELTPPDVVLRASEGGPFPGLLAIFTDIRGGRPPSDYSASVLWDSNLEEPAEIVALPADSGGGAASGPTVALISLPRSLYRGTGLKAVQVSVRTKDSILATTHVMIDIQPAPLDLAGTAPRLTAGVPSQALVATFTGNPSDFEGRAVHAQDFTATITWSDPSAPGGPPHVVQGVVTTDVPGRFGVWGTLDLPAWGAVPLTVDVEETGAGGARVTTTAFIDPAPIAATAAPIRAVEGAAFSGRVASFTVADPDATAGEFAAVVDWGDGTSGAAAVRADGRGGFDVLGGHVYARGGTHRVIATISGLNPLGARFVVGSSTSTAAVAFRPMSVVGLPIAAVEGVPFRGVVAGFRTGNPLAVAADFAATIHWGDGRPASAGLVVADGRGGFLVAGLHAFSQAGRLPVLVTVRRTGADVSAPPGYVATVARVATPAGVTTPAGGSPLGARPGALIPGETGPTSSRHGRRVGPRHR